MKDVKGYDYIDRVKELACNIEDYISQSTCNRLVVNMENRQQIADNRNITKLRKLKQITSWTTYEFGENSYDARNLAEPTKLSLKHTIYLINKLLQFDELVENEDNIRYERVVHGFSATMLVNKYGFILTIKNGDKTLLSRRVGDVQLRHGDVNWYVVSKEVKENLDFGIFEQKYGLRSDTFEVVYKVHEKDISSIIDRVRQAFIDNGLNPINNSAHSWTISNAKIIESSSARYPDILSIRTSYVCQDLTEFEEALNITTSILREEGYTEKYER
ncbi:hypothetical protein COF68_05100 [Bacillus toyonensis]|uniref:hypothetical protein n=1 Tax=Bacillus toyonensis TaxID=155322 RepID=UPI000BFB6D84|nr:hypothetical protein [Bacillus toyonensis]PHE64224.1 hypothetical protein COF68_05100 [Bacillus toyonensis]